MPYSLKEVNEAVRSDPAAFADLCKKAVKAAAK